MKYFHIDTGSHHRNNFSQFRSGDKHVVEEKLNPLCATLNDSATRPGGGITGRGVYQSVSVILRELAFDNIRARAYSTLLSRASCIWLCALKESDRYLVNHQNSPKPSQMPELIFII